MRAVWVLAMKDLRLLARDRAAVFWVLAFPLAMAFLFGAMFGGGGGGKHKDDDERNAIPVAVVDAEHSRESAEFAKKLSASGDVEVTSAADVAAARGLVLHGDVAAYVALVSDFDGPGMFGGKPPCVEIGYAPSRRAESGMLRGIVMQTAAAKLTESLRSPGTGSSGAAEAMMPAHIDVVEVAAQKEPGADVAGDQLGDHVPVVDPLGPHRVRHDVRAVARPRTPLRHLLPDEDGAAHARADPRGQGSRVLPHLRARADAAPLDRHPRLDVRVQTPVAPDGGGLVRARVHRDHDVPRLAARPSSRCPA